MTTIKTQSNSIIVVEVPEDVINWQSLDIVLDWSKHKILGKLSELEDKDLERFVKFSINSIRTYKNYTQQRGKNNTPWERNEKMWLKSAKQSFISLLQSEGIDTNKNLLIIEVL